MKKIETRMAFKPKQGAGVGGKTPGKIGPGTSQLRTKKYGKRTPKTMIHPPKRQAKVDIGAVLDHMDPRKKGVGGSST